MVDDVIGSSSLIDTEPTKVFVTHGNEVRNGSPHFAFDFLFNEKLHCSLSIDIDAEIYLTIYIHINPVKIQIRNQMCTLLLMDRGSFYFYREYVLILNANQCLY